MPRKKLSVATAIETLAAYRPVADVRIVPVLYIGVGRRVTIDVPELFASICFALTEDRANAFVAYLSDALTGFVERSCVPSDPAQTETPVTFGGIVPAPFDAEFDAAIGAEVERQIPPEYLEKYTPEFARIAADIDALKESAERAGQQ